MADDLPRLSPVEAAARAFHEAQLRGLHGWHDFQDAARATLTAAVNALPKREIPDYGPCCQFGNLQLHGNSYSVPVELVHRAFTGEGE